MKEEDRMSKEIIGAAIEVHRHLGPGLPARLRRVRISPRGEPLKELEIRDIVFERQKHLAVVYKGMTLDCGYKLDIVVEDKVILELKSVNKIESIHEAQILTYLKLAGLKLGILINFNVPIVKQGLKRIVNNL